MLEISVSVHTPELAEAIKALATTIRCTQRATANPTPAPGQATAQPAQTGAGPLSAVPTSPPPAVTHDQVMLAGSALIDAGKIGELQALLARYGVQAVNQIAPDRLGAFATELRALGAAL